MRLVWCAYLCGMAPAWKVPYHRYAFAEAEEQAVLRVLRSGWLTTAHEVAAFEAAFAQFSGAAECVAVNSCTAGLAGLLAALGIGPGDDVLVPTFSFSATANVVQHVGARPVLTDVAAADLNVTAELLEQYRTPATRAAMIVHLAGNIAPMVEIMAWAHQHNIALIEDCAHATGASQSGQKAGCFGVGGSFSFYPNKNITTGEGGMVTVNEPDRVPQLRQWVNHGLSALPGERDTPAFRQYDILVPGFKFNMNEIQAALGRVQLAQLPAWQARRRAIYSHYLAAFAEHPAAWLYAPPIPDEGAYHLAILRLRPASLAETRAQIMQRISDAGVQLTVAYKPIHLFTAYQRLGYRPGDFPTAEAAYEACFALPIYPRMTDTDVETVIAVTLEALSAAKR